MPDEWRQEKIRYLCVRECQTFDDAQDENREEKEKVEDRAPRVPGPANRTVHIRKEGPDSAAVRLRGGGSTTVCSGT